jgi:hypothetical protein
MAKAKAAQKDYAALYASKMVRPADIKRMPRFLVYSRNKKGKTTLSLTVGIDNVLVLDPEAGTEEMKAKNPHVWPITRWEDIDDAYEFLRHINLCTKCNPHHPFRWASVDGLTKMSNMALKYVMKLEEDRSLTRQPGIVSNRDYGKAGELVKDMMVKFHNLPLGIVFTAQERQIEAFDSEEDEDYEDIPSAYVADLPKGVRNYANSIVDVIGRLYVVRTDDDPPKKERRLWVGESARYDTGYRSDFVLPDYIKNPTIPKLVTLMRTGEIPKAKKATTKK